MRIAVIVLGDVGRSPRMQYHACSLSNLDGIKEVILIGYDGEECMDILEESLVKCIRFKLSDPKIDHVPFIRTIYKAIELMFNLYSTLMSHAVDISSLDFIIIQNPPAAPAAIVAIIFSWFYSVKIIIDWHNLGFKMFEESLGSHHFLVKISKIVEFLIAQFAHGHICVSKAMHSWLKLNFKINPVVLYDKPSSIFNKDGTSFEIKQELFVKYKLTDNDIFPTPLPSDLSSSSEPSSAHSPLSFKPSLSMRVIVSSTSWTPDEDFDMLLDAMLILNDRLKSIHLKSHIICNKAAFRSSVDLAPTASTANQTQRGIMNETVRFLPPPRTLLIITGKGPLRDDFMKRVHELEKSDRLMYVAIRSLWVSATGDLIYL